jgi:hypothetical protein
MGARPYDPAVGRFLAVDPVDGGSLNNYDYAGQDPINNYDLDGTMTPGPPGVGWPAGIAFSGYCGGFCGGIESSAPTMSQRRAAVETALFFGLPGVLKGAEIAAATVWGTRAGVVAAERAEIAIAAHEATPPNVSRLGEVAHVAGHVAYPSVKAAVAKAAPRVAKAAIRRAKSGAAIGLRQLGR